MNFKLLLPVLAVMPFCAAQEMWELGALGGYGFTRNATISNGAGSVSAGLKNGPVVAFTGGTSEYKYLGAEAGYVYRAGDLKLSGSGAEPNFSGQTHFADFRFLVHFTPIQSRIRPFAAVGGGVAVYMGSGEESSTQPLNNFAALTNTRQTKPMASAAIGVKARISNHMALRFELRDYMTPFPDQVIAPVPGASASGWLHNFMPMVGITGVF
jgi:hypothetical protein